MSRRAPASMCGLILLAGVLISLLAATLPAASAQQETAQQEQAATETSSLEPSDQFDIAATTDAELYQALVQAGLLESWVVTSGISEAAALVNVDTTDSAYLAARAGVIAELRLLAERVEHRNTRVVDAEDLLDDVATLERVIRDLRREVATAGRSAAASLTPESVEEAHAALATLGGDQRWLSLSFDSITLARHRMLVARDDLEDEVDRLRKVGQRTKDLQASVVGLTEIHGELTGVRKLIADGIEQAGVDDDDYRAHEAAIVISFGQLHELRLLLRSEVGGLPVVTLDAYVRGAAALDASCPVDWALLAGIGRVESRHGTIDDTTVQRSGRVTKDILGPLLDGGATEREAVQASKDAAAAEEARLFAEAEAEAEQAAEAAAITARLFGVVEEESRGDEESDDAADEPDADAPPPRYDPRLWGDDLPFDEDDLDLEDEDDDDGAGDDEEEPEFKGNGFAVIVDSDNGRLDGNSRWDRAVGPMQFIPETWSYWETDGNDDGVIDPQNLYDAAATAGQFLCHLSRTRGSSPQSFVLGYNSSRTYVRNVMAVADAFGEYELPGSTD